MEQLPKYLSRIRSLGLLFVYIGIFLIPFNSYEGPSFLGEYNKHPCTYFFLIAFLISTLFIFLKRKIYFPFKNVIFQLLLLFIMWCAVTMLLNIHNILDYYLKGTTGLVRFIKQYGSLIISALIFLLTFINLFNGMKPIELFKKIRFIYFLSFLVVSVYAFFEILIVFFKIYSLKPVLKLFNYFPFTTVNLSTNLERISSVSFEPPELGTYLIFIGGWMFSYILTEQGLKKYIPGLVVLILAFFSDSRSGIAIIIFQFILFVFLLYKQKKFHTHLYKLVTIASFPLLVLFIFKGATITTYVFEKMTSFSISDSTHGGSNKSRLGIQLANLKVFAENPISGVGFGQSAFASREHYPRWATDNNWEFRSMYLNPYHKPFPSVYNMYVRLLSETGIVGLILFSSFLFFLLWTCYKFCISHKEYDLQFRIFAIVLFITFAGVILNWLKTETFRIFGFWVALAFFLVLTGNKLKLYDKS